MMISLSHWGLFDGLEAPGPERSRVPWDALLKMRQELDVQKEYGDRCREELGRVQRENAVLQRRFRDLKVEAERLNAALVVSGHRDGGASEPAQRRTLWSRFLRG